MADSSVRAEEWIPKQVRDDRSADKGPSTSVAPVQEVVLTGGLQAPSATLRGRPMSSTGKIITTPKPTRTRGAVWVVPV